MKIVTIDWETFFDMKTYTLKNMTTEEYVRDPRFDAHGCAIKWSPSEPARWYDKFSIRGVIRDTDWSDKLVLHHHSQFDSLIENVHYGMRPGAIGCTLSMARLMLGNHISVSLDSVRKHFGIPFKFTPYDQMSGKHWEEMTQSVQNTVARGACDEVESIYRIFCEFMRMGFPPAELRIVDAVVRMFTEPVLRGDIDLLAKIWESEETRKAGMLADLDVPASDLQSSVKFADLLRQEGIEPGLKANPKGEMIYAFAKNDAFMYELRESESFRVQALAMARLEIKSTIIQSRAETLGYMASRGPLVIYYRYCGAHTTRDSGGDDTNFTNLKRKSDLRKAIMAPEGYWLGIVDKAQIERRCLCYLANEKSMLDKFRRGEDPYVDTASILYGERVYKPEKGDPRYDEMDAKRGSGKLLELSGQYQAGGRTIQATAKAGTYGAPMDISLETAEEWKNKFRQMHPELCAPRTGYWAEAGRMIARIAGGDPLQWGPMIIRDKRIYGPDGTFLIYDTLEWHLPTAEECEKLDNFKWNGFWRFRTRSGWAELYPGKLVQNICEFLCRIMLNQATLRIIDRNFKIVMRTYDEVVVLIRKDADAEKNLQVCIDEMRREPAWLPGIPLDAEATLSERYSK